MSKLVAPHGGGPLKPLLLPRTERAEEIRRAKKLKKVPLTSREVSDLFMLAMGAYTPLDGFMGEQDWRGCCTEMKTSSGLFWPIPITLSAQHASAASIVAGSEIALADPASGALLGAALLALGLAWQAALVGDDPHTPPCRGERARRRATGSGFA